MKISITKFCNLPSYNRKNEFFFNYCCCKLNCDIEPRILINNSYVFFTNNFTGKIFRNLLKNFKNKKTTKFGQELK